MKKISFLGKVIAMLRNIRIGNQGLFIARCPFKGYGIGLYKRALAIEIWEFTIFLISNNRYFIA